MQYVDGVNIKGYVFNSTCGQICTSQIQNNSLLLFNYENSVVANRADASKAMTHRLCGLVHEQHMYCTVQCVQYTVCTCTVCADLCVLVCCAETTDAPCNIAHAVRVNFCPVGF